MVAGYTIIVLSVFVSAADPCQPNPCEHGGECHHFGGGYVCQCDVQCACAYHDVGANCEHVKGNYEPFLQRFQHLIIHVQPDTRLRFRFAFWNIMQFFYNLRLILTLMQNNAINSLSASLLLNIFLSFEVGIAHAIANFK